jgi:hypothetical protein
LRQKLRPALAQLGTNAVARHDRAVAELQQRISQRIAHLRQHLLAPPPKPLNLTPGQQTPLTGWLPSVEHGKATLSETAVATGVNVLQARLAAGDKSAVATWQTRVLLPKGRYLIAASVSCDQPVFRGPTSPVAIKLWGGVEVQTESNRRDAQHLDLLCAFAITSDIPEDLVLQCQFTGAEGAVTFQLAPVTLMRGE